MSNILDLMRMGVDARVKVSLRDYEGYLRPLSVIELVRVGQDVYEMLGKLPVSARNAITEHTLTAQHMLQAASTSSPDKHDPQLPVATLQMLTSDEMMHLFKQYVAECDKINPSLETIKPERLAELVEIAKKNPLILIEYSFLELVNVCRALIEILPVGK